LSLLLLSTGNTTALRRYFLSQPVRLYDDEILTEGQLVYQQPR
jgi:hypothetical protein